MNRKILMLSLCVSQNAIASMTRFTDGLNSAASSAQQVLGEDLSGEELDSRTVSGSVADVAAEAASGDALALRTGSVAMAEAAYGQVRLDREDIILARFKSAIESVRDEGLAKQLEKVLIAFKIFKELKQHRGEIVLFFISSKGDNLVLNFLKDKNIFTYIDIVRLSLEEVKEFRAMLVNGLLSGNLELVMTTLDLDYMLDPKISTHRILEIFIDLLLEKMQLIPSQLAPNSK